MCPAMSGVNQGKCRDKGARGNSHNYPDIVQEGTRSRGLAALLAMLVTGMSEHAGTRGSGTVRLGLRMPTREGLQRP